MVQSPGGLRACVGSNEQGYCLPAASASQARSSTCARLDRYRHRCPSHSPLQNCRLTFPVTRQFVQGVSMTRASSRKKVVSARRMRARVSRRCKCVLSSLGRERRDWTAPTRSGCSREDLWKAVTSCVLTIYTLRKVQSQRLCLVQGNL